VAAGLAGGAGGNLGRSYRKETPSDQAVHRREGRPRPRPGHLLRGHHFRKIAFNPSVGIVASKPERGRLGGTSWNRFNALNTASFVVAGATWLSGRSGLSGWGMDRRARNLVLAKDALMGVAGCTGLTVLILQIVLYRQAPEGAVPLETGGVPAAEASGRASRLQRTVSALGSVHIALFAGLVALTTVLSAEKGQPTRRSVLSRRTR
jgi:hypothetical protein